MVSPTILLIEDDSSDENLALRALAKSVVKCSVEVVRDGEQAVNYIRDVTKSCPDLVLLDLKLPRMNGHEVLKVLRTERRNWRCPVVVFTSSEQPEDRKSAFDEGANSYVRKPVDFDEYMEYLNKIAEYWLAISQPFS